MEMSNSVAEELAKLFHDFSMDAHERKRVTHIVNLAKRDTRHRCAEVIAGMDDRNHASNVRACIDKDAAYQAVMNAE